MTNQGNDKAHNGREHDPNPDQFAKSSPRLRGRAIVEARVDHVWIIPPQHPYGWEGVTVRIIAFGTYDSGAHPRVEILLAGLRDRGAEVVEVNIPLGFSTHERVAMLERPLLAFRLLARIAGCWPRLVARSWRARHRGPVDAVLVGYLGHFDVLLARVLFPRSTVVLDLLIFGEDTAHDRGVTYRLRSGALRALDSIAIRAASIVVVDTPEHAEMVGGRGVSVVVPVGAPLTWFRPPRARDSTRPMTVLFYGLFTPLQGTPTLGRAIGDLTGKDISFTLIGTGQDYDACRGLAAINDGVNWIDWMPPERLADMAAQHDVCLGIFGTTPKSLRVVPNKVYQGAAAACAIVTSATDPQERALGDAAVYVPAGDHLALAAALEQLASDPARGTELSRAAHERAQHLFTPSDVVSGLWVALLPGAGDRR